MKKNFSRIIHGMWRLLDWQMSSQELLSFIQKCISLGVTTFDHADIYGNYMCEEYFGEAISLKPELRKRMQIITKCGIKLVSSKRPLHSMKSYETSAEHIVGSVERSLKNLQTDYVDLLLIHRPDPLMNPDEVKRAFEKLRKDGKVLRFGVSNFMNSQTSLLQSCLNFQLEVNQIELSVASTDYFFNGVLDYCMENSITPIAWSPLAGGQVFSSDDEQVSHLRTVLAKIAKNHNTDSISKIMYAWLIKHPAGILPICGSGKIERVQEAVESLDINLSREEWFEILEASRGHEVA